MTGTDEKPEPIPPTQRSGGTPPGEAEAREKGPWAARAAEGVVPAELGGSDAPEQLRPDDPELGSSVLGATTGSDAPATGSGIDPSAGDQADATSDGGARPPAGAEPDLRDAAAGARAVDRESAQ